MLNSDIDRQRGVEGAKAPGVLVRAGLELHRDVLSDAYECTGGNNALIVLQLEYGALMEAGTSELCIRISFTADTDDGRNIHQ